MSSSRPRRGEATARGLLWLLLGGWLGAWLLFALVVAPSAFGRLDAPGQAGAVVSPVLHTLHLYGGFAGLGLALLGGYLGRSRWLVLLPLAMGALCLYSELAITHEIAAIRPQVFGPEPNAAAAERFGQLHRESMVLYTVVGLAGFLLLGLHARSDVRELRGERTPEVTLALQGPANRAKSPKNA